MVNCLDTDHKQRFSSDVLWHFVGRQHNGDADKSLPVMVSILKDGLNVGGGPEPFNYINPEKEKLELFGYPVACLADIPLKDLSLHSERYGEFAIGFHKANAIRSHFNPVLYVQQMSHLMSSIMERRGEIEDYLNKTNEKMAEKFGEFLLFLGSMSKPCNLLGELYDDDKIDELHMNNFYYEREWRSVYPWEFKPDDVAMLIVNTEENAKSLYEIIQNTELRIEKNVPILTFNMVHKL